MTANDRPAGKTGQSGEERHLTEREGPRYQSLARVLLDSPDPVHAIASLLGDHEARLDILAEQVQHLDCVIGQGQSR